MLDHLVKTKDKVGYLLENYPPLRDDDKKLWLAFLNVFCDMKIKLENDPNPYLVYKDIILNKDTPSFESLGRVRRKFQEVGKYVGEKRQERLEEASNVKDWAIETNY